MDSYGNIYPLSNPWLATTTSIAVSGWIIAFVGGCVAAMHGIIWWIIIFELFFTVGTVIAIGLGGFGPHRGMLLTFLAISIVYLTFGIPLAMTHHSSGGRTTVGGLIILIIMQGFWVFLLGCSEESPVYGFFYGGLLGGGRGGRPSFRAPPMIQRNFVSQNQGNNHPHHHHNHEEPASSQQNFPVGTALHSYQANPEDPSELSFSKGEEFDILDNKGNWWQARKQDGSIGIVPSNYIRLAQ